MLRRAFYNSKKRTHYGAAVIQRDTYGKPSEWYALCKRVHERDGHRCCFCKAPEYPLVPGVYHQTHHILALSRSGTTSMANLITVCKDCHKTKHPRNKTLQNS
jgi:5-methylcytosine-specific restriction endonuclease McrA